MVIPRQWVSLKSGMLSELVNRIYLEKENGKHNLAASPVSKALLLLKEASWAGEEGAPSIQHPEAFMSFKKLH